MKRTRTIFVITATLCTLGTLPAWIACSRDGGPSTPALEAEGLPATEAGLDPRLEVKSLSVVRNDGRTPPPGLVPVTSGGRQLMVWPYTGSSFDGSPVDPINVIFKGKAAPLRIRAALLALDGDRTAFGLPDAWPFNATWTDCIGGNVQTAYARGGIGWSGSVVQLMLGAYEPIRFHLRLFRTGVPCGAGGEWTLGGAHFEVRIPGTADHQVLSWEVAQQIVLVDMMRSGLLDPAQPYVSSGVISSAPSFRTIPAVIYNGLPPELIALIGGPQPPVTDDVPLVSDGEATIFNLVGQAPLVPGTWNQVVDLTYGQVVPKPFCSDGPYDYLLVTGPIRFTATFTLTAGGSYRYHSGYDGHLEATPVDVTGGQPVPIGAPYSARVFGSQQGQLSRLYGWVMSGDKKLTRPAGGPELIFESLLVPDLGFKSYHAITRCLDDDIS